MSERQPLYRTQASECAYEATYLHIKYFHSERQHITGRKRRVPQIVIGTDIEHVRELGLLWMNRKNAELARHPVQITILEEAIAQLEAFIAYARAQSARADTADILTAELSKVQALHAAKKEQGLVGIKNDQVFAEIRHQLESFR